MHAVQNDERRFIAMIVDLPIKTGRGLNDSVHWAVRAKATKKVRGDVRLALLLKLSTEKWLWPIDRTLRVRVKLTRISAGEMDDDGLTGALKAVRDGVADAFGTDDSSRSSLRFEYAQEKCKRGYFGVRIQIDPED
jgi:hypothetical protein